MLFLMKRTLPSAKQALTPPVCLLRDMPEVMRLPFFMQPSPSTEPMVAVQNDEQVWISSPSLPESPRLLFGVGLLAARPALTMLELGKPRAQTPRGSSGDFPARSSATAIVLDRPSMTSA